MQVEDDTSRPEIIIAGLVYLMSCYAGSGCPRLAVCISRHMQCLALHPDAPRVVRETCAALHGAWSRVAEGGAAPEAPLH